ncbi:unnamed protein product [Urochloa humidicola]
MAIPVSCGPPRQDELAATAKKQKKKATGPGNCDDASRSPEPVQPRAEGGPPPPPRNAQEAATAQIKKRPGPVQADKEESSFSQASAAARSPEATAAAACCKIQAKDSGDLEPKNRIQPAAAVSTSAKKSEGDEAQEAAASTSAKRSEEDRIKKDGAPTSEASWVCNFLARPWLQLRRLEGPGFLSKNSLLKHLFECCGLVDLVTSETSGPGFQVPQKDLKILHVSDERTLISEAKTYYKIEESLAKELSKLYSSFRVVRGDGECFYRSFIYSYLELVIENDDQSEENRLLCALENVSIACMDVDWLYDDFSKSYMAFKELVEKVKNWKSETRAVLRMLLLSYFGDYKETEAIFSFLRMSSATWLLTHPEFSAFFTTEDGTTLEEHCRSEVIRSRSFADHIAISALSDALGIQIQIFSFPIRKNIYSASSGESSAVPVVSLVFTGIHYDILYPI